MDTSPTKGCLNSRTGWLAGVLCAAVLASSPARAQPQVNRTAVRLLGGLSVDQGGFMVGAGIHHLFADRIYFGGALELNPWFNVLAGSMEPGTVNVYLTGAVRWVNTPSLEVRSSLALGTSTLLFDLYDFRVGKTGPYLGASVLGVGFHLSREWMLEVKPDLVLLIPQFRGTPLVYHQYRLTFALERLF